MQTFTGFEYLLIDAANNFGLDKETYDSRIIWTKANLDKLETLVEEADDKEQFYSAVLAIREAQAGKPSGHLVGFDAICSGMQIMSAITGCHSGAQATGLIDTGYRPDAYNETTEEMGRVMGGQFLVDRKDVKAAVMTMLYGSKAKPQEIFGKETPELAGFYQAVTNIAPGAYELLQVLLDSWQPFTLMHRWVLPDGFVARVKVMETVDARIEVDEMDHASFTYEWKENVGSQTGLSNVANVIHSIDAYVLRSLIRRCSYDPSVVQRALQYCTTEIMERDLAGLAQDTDLSRAPEAIQKYVERFQATNIVDAVILPYLNHNTVIYLSDDHLRRLNLMMESMLEHKPFHVVAIHDDFRCHPNYMNYLRAHYRHVFIELANSEVLSDILSQIHGVAGTYRKLSSDLSEKIAGSQYAIC